MVTDDDIIIEEDPSEVSDLEKAAEDPNNAYESDLDETAIGTNRQAEPPDGVDEDWTELHPSFAKTYLEVNDEAT